MKKELLEEFDVEKRKLWRCPAETGVPIITMPNIYKALHGVAPRTVLGNRNWNKMRKKCYFDADYKCEVCGAEGTLHAHELYDTNWEKGFAKFDRCVCLCPKCHLLGIHTGRAITLFKKGNPLYTSSRLLDGAEHTFRLVSEYNEQHPDNQLRVYATFLNYLNQPELEGTMRRLIKQYNIKFYIEDIGHIAAWSKWKLIIDDKVYPTPYKSYFDWQEKIERQSEKDFERKVENPFSGGAFDGIREMIKEASEQAGQ